MNSTVKTKKSSDSIIEKSVCLLAILVMTFEFIELINSNLYKLDDLVAKIMSS